MKIMNEFVRELRTTKGVRSTGDSAQKIAEKLGCDHFLVQAIFNVESRSGPFDDRGRLIILPEKHQFWKHLPAEKRKTAERLGLGHKGWRRKTQYKGLGRAGDDRRWDLLEKMADLDEYAALMSFSGGGPQIMGFNYRICGWSSVQEFWRDMAAHEDHQMKAFFNFLKSRNLIDELQEYDIQSIVRVYNGPGQVALYSGRVAAEYQKLAGKPIPSDTSPVRMAGLRRGSSGERVRALQTRLKDLGYALRVDGDFGMDTYRQVLAFQAENNLKADGIVGPKTQVALDNAQSIIEPEREFADVKEVSKRSNIVKKSRLTQWFAGLFGGGTAAGKGMEQMGLIDQAQMFADRGEQVFGIWGTFKALLGPFWGVFGDLFGFFLNNLWLTIPIVCLFIWSFAGDAIKSRVEDHQEGKTK